MTVHDTALTFIFLATLAQPTLWALAAQYVPVRK
jgi:hypothetical protein